MPTNNATHKTFSQREQYAKKWLGRIYWDYRDRIILNNIDQKANIILDAGCGEGITLEKLSRAYPDKEIRGLEIDQERIDICLSRGLAVTRENLLQLNTPAASIDCCILSEVIEHFQYQDALFIIKEMHRILSKDGTLIVVFPNDYAFKFARIAVLMFEEAFADSGHLWQWTPASMKNQLSRLGFKIKKITNIPFLAWPLSLHCVIVAYKNNE
jgi:ubiquinone/menaquinone biosynthesis C-methylase UbiE